MQSISHDEERALGCCSHDLRHAAANLVVRTELRFARCSTQRSDSRDAVDAVVQGVTCRAGTNGVIICALRSRCCHSMEMAQLAVDANIQTNGVVCGFDIAGDEGSYPLSMHRVSAHAWLRY